MNREGQECPFLSSLTVEWERDRLAFKGKNHRGKLDELYRRCRDDLLESVMRCVATIALWHVIKEGAPFLFITGRVGLFSWKWARWDERWHYKNISTEIKPPLLWGKKKKNFIKQHQPAEKTAWVPGWLPLLSSLPWLPDLIKWIYFPILPKLGSRKSGEINIPLL